MQKYSLIIALAGMTLLDQNEAKMKEIKFNLVVLETIQGNKEEEIYPGVTILGSYATEFDQNEGYRAQLSGGQIKNFNYDDVVSMTVAL